MAALIVVTTGGHRGWDCWLCVCGKSINAIIVGHARRLVSVCIHHWQLTLGGYLLAGLEAPYARTNWDDLPEADAVVVLRDCLWFEYEITGLDLVQSGSDYDGCGINSAGKIKVLS